jgi:hypothetical protein
MTHKPLWTTTESVISRSDTKPVDNSVEASQKVSSQTPESVI